MIPLSAAPRALDNFSTAGSWGSAALHPRLYAVGRSAGWVGFHRRTTFCAKYAVRLSHSPQVFHYFLPVIQVRNAFAKPRNKLGEMLQIQSSEIELILLGFGVHAIIPDMKVSTYDLAARTLPASLKSDDRQHISLAATFLKEQGAKRVWLFGSLAKGRQPTVHSDFDFAVEGLPGERLFGSVGHLLQILLRPVDVVELEGCPTLLRQQILDHGIILAESS